MSLQMPAFTFPQLKQLSDDIVLNILSFVADVPFEASEDMDFHSNLTHILPHVCKQFYTLLKRSDFLWQSAIERLVANEAFLWEEGLQNLIVDCKMEVQNSHNTPNINLGTIGSNLGAARREANHSGQEVSNTEDSVGIREKVGNVSYEQHLVAKASNALVATPSFRRDLTEEQITEKKLLVHQWVFRYVLSNHLRYTSPVFYMPGTVRLNGEIGLHFFEPRYRLLISEVMSRFPVSARRGEPIVVESKRDYPSFVYAHKSPLSPTSPACIVQVRQCLIHPNGSADVFLVPSAHVWIDRVTARPSSGGLADVRVIRMSQAASTAMEYASASLLDSNMDAEDYDDDSDVERLGIRGSIHEILAYLAARQDGMMFNDDELDDADDYFDEEDDDDDLEEDEDDDDDDIEEDENDEDIEEDEGDDEEISDR